MKDTAYRETLNLFHVLINVFIYLVWMITDGRLACIESMPLCFISVYFGEDWLYIGRYNRTEKVWWAATRLGWTNTWKWL
jgi:hypothetical protein